jgi:hypothetical protein
MISIAWSVPAGLVGSGAGALFGTSAPPYIIYLTHRLPDKSSLRATFSCLFVIDGGFRLALFTGAGLFMKSEVQNALLGASCRWFWGSISAIEFTSRFRTKPC